MLATIKKLMKSWFAAVLLGLVMISTAFLGQQMDVLGAFSGNSGTWVVKAGSQTVTPKEFNSLFERMRKNAEQQYQRQISTQDAIKGGLEKQALEELMSSESLNAMLKKMGLRAPQALVDEAMKQQLAQYPGVFDEITGELNLAELERLLTQNNLDVETYRKGLEGSIVEAQFFGAMTAGFKAPRILSSLQGAYSLEERDLDYFIVTPASVGAIPQPTEAEMQAFLKENAARLMRPEMRVIKLVRFNAEEFRSKVTADPAEVQKRFDFRKDTLSSPELRSFVQIPVKNAGQATQVAARLTKGEDPAAIAKSVGASVVNNTDKPKSAIFDKAVADAAFRLPVGAVSGALQGELGQSVIKVTGITPAKVATLEEHRAELEADVIKSAAANKAYEQAQAFDKAHIEGATLDQAAAKVGATVITLPAMTAQGQSADPRNPPNPKIVTKEVLDTAFGLPANSDSTLIEVTAGDQFFVRVEKIIPPSPPALDEVRPELTKLLMGQKQARLMQAKAKDLSDRARKGESLAAVAASGGYKLVSLPKMTRQGAQQHEALGNELLTTLFTGATGQVFTAPVQGEGGGLAVGKIGAIRPGDVGQIAQATEMGRQGFARGIFQDINTTTRAWAKDEIKPKSDRDRAIKALGEDPAAYAEKKDEKDKAKDAKSK
ncbi:peptidylprolyl isomerase [Caulobacter sp. NIBR1757]|uniref:peptidylprolyl isomerase n=1 Tax=Caulobacter sp. NIBR1757 TaxID=3016000 RepID=UPI0022F0AFA2|nr:peptidylprolyl isomerase [Caulobacter sp. NIBR1757]WGM39406.1 Peptidyl-prolyl cis-trans isomerase D [Caulobacter sp. NIBR1757]